MVVLEDWRMPYDIPEATLTANNRQRDHPELFRYAVHIFGHRADDNNGIPPLSAAGKSKSITIH